jgi:hypothetical protein
MDAARQTQTRRLTGIEKPPSLRGAGGMESNTEIDFPAVA